MNNIKGHKVLVTGGAGFIGSHLVDELIKEGCYVRVLDNLSNGKLDNLQNHQDDIKFEFLKGSVTNPADVRKALKDVNIVFHLACLGVRHSIKNPFENHKVNALGTLLVLKESQEAGIERFVYCSSSEIYGTAKHIPMGEAHPVCPSTVYGASKLAGEIYTRTYYQMHKMNTIIVRPFNTYGPRSHYEGDAGEIIPKTIVRALNGEPVLIFGDGSQTRDFTYVKDIAEALIRAVKNNKIVGLTLNIGSNFEISINKVVHMILEMTGSSSSIRNVNMRPGDVLRLFADSTRFRKMTGWKPKVLFEKGLLRVIKWFQSRPEGATALLSQEKGINWE